MSILSLPSLDSLLHQYGYAAVFVGVMLESTGLPLPGESLMIAAAIYVALTHQLNIFILIPVAAAAAICGDQIGYLIGRWIGFRALTRWGSKLGLTDERLELGRFLFRWYGGRVVFFGRFVAFLRTFAALLAGQTRCRGTRSWCGIRWAEWLGQVFMALVPTYLAMLRDA
jgi:membrane protein DedA with SNARE-associated domain